VQQHLHFVQPTAPGARILARRQEGIDIAPGDPLGRMGLQIKCPLAGKIPAVRRRRLDAQAVVCQERVQARGQRIRFRASQGEGMGAEQARMGGIDAQMHRVRSQPPPFGHRRGVRLTGPGGRGHGPGRSGYAEGAHEARVAIRVALGLQARPAEQPGEHGQFGRQLGHGVGIGDGAEQTGDDQFQMPVTGHAASTLWVMWRERRAPRVVTGADSGQRGPDDNGAERGRSGSGSRMRSNTVRSKPITTKENGPCAEARSSSSRRSPSPSLPFLPSISGNTSISATSNPGRRPFSSTSPRIRC